MKRGSRIDALPTQVGRCPQHPRPPGLRPFRPETVRSTLSKQPLPDPSHLAFPHNPSETRPLIQPMEPPKKRFALAIAATCFAASAASADTFQKYGEVEGWKVVVDVEKKSCLIEAVDSVENVVQMGLTEDRSVGYVGIFTKGETDIKAGETSEIAILIGDNIYVGEATGMRGNITKGYSGGYVLSDSPQFAEDIAQQYEMLVFPETEYSFIVDLSGTKKAMEMARACNDKQIAG